MTKWEIGQDLIAINDFMGEKVVDFRNAGETELAEKVNELRAEIGELFNQNNDHGFGIFDKSSLSRSRAYEEAQKKE